MTAAALLMVALLVSWNPGAAAGQADAEGVWQARYTTTEGRSHEFTLTIKTSGGVVSGTISSPRGSVPITDGTLNGRDVAFTVTRRADYDQIDVTFKGSIDGDVMRLTMQVGNREPIAVTARRVPGRI